MSAARDVIGKHLMDVVNGGPKVLVRKTSVLVRLSAEALHRVISFVVAIFLYGVIRILEPVVLIRTGKLESPAIGHFSLPVEMYLSELDCGLHAQPARAVDIWYFDKTVCNSFLKATWDRYLIILPRFLVQPLDTLIRSRLHRHKNMVPMRYWYGETTPWQVYDIHDVLDRTHTHITFTPGEASQCVSVMRRMGLNSDDRIVCFNARDSAYYNDDSPRNSCSQTLVPAMKALSSLGYKSIRLGAEVTESLHVADPNIVDYSTMGLRSEMLDLYLVSKAAFMVGTGSGIDCLAPTFRRPLVTVNWVNFGWADQWDRNSLFIPKKVWSVTENRPLTFRELYQRGVHFFTSQQEFSSLNLKWIDNSPDEIKAVVLEMEKRLVGSWHANSEDEALQEEFRATWPIRRNGRAIQGRIGAEFLRQNTGLLK